MKSSKSRIIFVFISLMLFFCMLIGRLFYIQVLHGAEFAIRCREQSKHRSLVSAKRGTIRDRNGAILACSVSRNVSIETKQLVFGSDSLVKTKNGIALIRRVYPYGEFAGPVLGYVGKDGLGLAGIEYTFDHYLKGENGWRIVQKNGLNKRYSRIDMPHKQPVDGNDVYLTIDVRIQNIVEKVLTQQVHSLNAKSGMCIVMDPATGEILAMANVPDFNPSIWAKYPSENRKNRCISYNYEPGSTFKVVTAASALQENIFTEGDTLDGNMGVYKVYDQIIRDHKKYGYITFEDALAYSSNVCFAKIANALGNERLYQYTRNFGFGSQTGVLLPGEEKGIVHPINKWSGRTRVTMAMGQEISATFMQMMALFSTIANDGIFLEPAIWNKVVGENGDIIDIRKDKIKRRVLKKEIAMRLRKMMASVVRYGTAQKIAMPHVALAGKTGTSQKIDKEAGGYSSDKVWASFIGMAPVDNPQIVCGVVIDEPANNESGSKAAGPVVQKIIQQLIGQPELNYAEKLLCDSVKQHYASSKGKDKRKRKIMPQLCGLTRLKAAEICREKNIAYTIQGENSVIRYQSRRSGDRIDDDFRVMLYASLSLDGDSKSTRKMKVPDCMGEDLRDAINLVSVNGLVPFVSGNGKVIRQSPVHGKFLTAMALCTLVCSINGHGESL